MKGYRVTKIVKKIKLELESKQGLQRQSFTKYMTLTLVFI